MEQDEVCPLETQLKIIGGYNKSKFYDLTSTTNGDSFRSHAI